MNFDITRLNSGIVSSVPIDMTYSFKSEELKGTDIIKLDNVKIEGELFKNSLGDISISCNVRGVMVLPCAITLNPVDYPFEINIDGSIDEFEENYEENETNFKNTIDIFPIIWENILMEVPTRVVSEEAKKSNIEMSGEGWSFMAEEENNSPLSELMNYIDDSEVK